MIAFQTWLGVRDAQILVRLTDGRVFSFDHGDAFGDTTDRSDPQVTVVDIPGVDPTVGKRPGDVLLAVRGIQDITDDQIVGAVSGIPSGDPWHSPVARRTHIVEYLIHRRARLEEVMTNWAHS